MERASTWAVEPDRAVNRILKLISGSQRQTLPARYAGQIRFAPVGKRALLLLPSRVLRGWRHSTLTFDLIRDSHDITQDWVNQQKQDRFMLKY